MLSKPSSSARSWNSSIDMDKIASQRSYKSANWQKKPSLKNASSIIQRRIGRTMKSFVYGTKSCKSVLSMKLWIKCARSCKLTRCLSWPRILNMALTWRPWAPSPTISLIKRKIKSPSLPRLKQSIISAFVGRNVRGFRWKICKVEKRKKSARAKILWPDRNTSSWSKGK